MFPRMLILAMGATLIQDLAGLARGASVRALTEPDPRDPPGSHATRLHVGVRRGYRIALDGGIFLLLAGESAAAFEP